MPFCGVYTDFEGERIPILFVDIICIYTVGCSDSFTSFSCIIDFAFSSKMRTIRLFLLNYHDFRVRLLYHSQVHK